MGDSGPGAVAIGQVVMVGLLSKVGRESLVLARRDGTEALVKDVRRVHLLEPLLRIEGLRRSAW